MKIGTDGVLLGAWASPKIPPKTILDIGTGTGVISLMMAQRYPAARITAIELDQEAAQQCGENFENSPWKDRLTVLHENFKDYNAAEGSYDLIISNPPFFKEPAFNSKARTMARNQSALPFENLMSGVSNLLHPQGDFAVIIPYEQEEKFMKLAEKFGLFPNQITQVKGRSETPIKRSLICLNSRKNSTERSQLTLEISRHEYTNDYIKLVKDFYLKM